MLWFKSIQCSIKNIFYGLEVRVLLMTGFSTKPELLIVTWLLLSTLIIGKHHKVLVLQKDFDEVHCLEEEIDFRRLVFLLLTVSPVLFIQFKNTIKFGIFKAFHHSPFYLFYKHQSPHLCFHRAPGAYRSPPADCRWRHLPLDSAERQLHQRRRPHR